MKWRHVDLFSGIGGMSLALHGCSETVMYCEICPHARMVLEARMQVGHLDQAPIAEDIRNVTSLPSNVDCITGGFPCTGFSIGGHRMGFANEASAMFFELVRVCGIVMPKVVFMENTPWIAKDVNMQQVKHAFEPLGYELRWCLLPAYAIGLPQKRMRWFCIATKCDQAYLTAMQSSMLHPKLIAGDMPSRSVSVEDPAAFRRYALLRNAVVPQCARMAFYHLLDPVNQPLPLVVKPDLGLVVTDGVVTIRKTLWPTLHGHYERKASKLTIRSSSDIGTALMYEVATLPGHINIDFLEWMMGYPVRWTKVCFKASRSFSERTVMCPDI